MIRLRWASTDVACGFSIICTNGIYFCHLLLLLNLSFLGGFVYTINRYISVILHSSFVTIQLTFIMCPCRQFVLNVYMGLV